MMIRGAHYVHKRLREELEDYIKSQYFGKSPILLKAIGDRLKEKDLLYKEPYIESSPAYKTVPDGIQKSSIPPILKRFFKLMEEAGLGIFPAPFLHQVQALEYAYQGKDLFVSTGTGSGKTECFMWPLMSKFVLEASTQPNSWERSGVRTIIMYPMNALVSDQISRLRRLIGDPDDKFLNIFRTICGSEVRRPRFGMYTGRTPYPGNYPKKEQNMALAETLNRLTEEEVSNIDFYRELLEEGKIPAKEDLPSFIADLKNSRHVPYENDAELITRFEMQQFPPDILITNYSMLEYMLLRPREKKIWDDTKNWLRENPDQKLLFIIDEAHMYRGSSGGEVALLIRRLLHKLQIDRSRVQFILTTASMPNGSKEDRQKVQEFTKALTASKDLDSFQFLFGSRENIVGNSKYHIPKESILGIEPNDFEEIQDGGLLGLNKFWSKIPGFPKQFNSLEKLEEWMYSHLTDYYEFNLLLDSCRGEAISLGELAHKIFPNYSEDDGLRGISVLLLIAPFAKNNNGAVLFPARMHMLFRGLKGVYACVNENCPNAHTEDGLTLGDIFLSDGVLKCPKCGSMVYELYNDRRCGALFYKGYIMKGSNGFSEHGYLWRYPGQIIDKRMKEIHLYIPPEGYYPDLKRKTNEFLPCYLDTLSGFIHFKDDRYDGDPRFRKLYYCDYSVKERPDIITFPSCPHCKHTLNKSQLTSFSTRGNLSFYNIIKTQFQTQPPVPGKDKEPERFPNQGRKVLLFSDSRQRAAKLAKDMTQASETTVIRQLFGLACYEMENSKNENSFDSFYDYLCVNAGKHNISLFSGKEGEDFRKDSLKAYRRYLRIQKRGRAYRPKIRYTSMRKDIKEYLIRLYSGAYNTLSETAVSWIEPTEDSLYDAMDELEDSGTDADEQEFLEVFNAWFIWLCDRFTAFGHQIDDSIRRNVRRSYSGYGLREGWEFPTLIMDIMNWPESDKMNWQRTLQDVFLEKGSDISKFYVKLDSVTPRFDLGHSWYQCKTCSTVTPYPLKDHCPNCGSEDIHLMDEDDLKALDFWRKPIINAINGESLFNIDTEEHTAQLSHKDQRDSMWSKTELYELRFRDLIKDDETPVDILSSTTTMEVGIDIGSLVAVGLRNIPPMRENYQQRAGRAGRRGASLSTIVTFCEDGPHDTLYFKDPVPMFRGDPRQPWIDIKSEKLLRRHLNIIVLKDFLDRINNSMDSISTIEFIDDYYNSFIHYLEDLEVPTNGILLPEDDTLDLEEFKQELIKSLHALKDKRIAHPELYATKGRLKKSLLDAVYEEGIIPTYSFPKNVVSMYMTDSNGRIENEVNRGLDIAISEFAPGRSIVVDKKTYQSGGLYVPGSDRQKGMLTSPASKFINDPNYLKEILYCDECGWFGLAEDNTSCPFCGNTSLTAMRKMLRPWGFAPKDGVESIEAQVEEEYTRTQQPLYSTLPSSDEMENVEGAKYIRQAIRTNQRIIMLNKGVEDRGFMVCCDCGAAFPGDDPSVLKDMERPYRNTWLDREKSCKHKNAINVNLGFDFITDMLVLEFTLDPDIIYANSKDRLWFQKAAQSLAEALRLIASKVLDVEFTELVTGYRFRKNKKGAFVDIYLYDNLSSGAGYAISVEEIIPELLDEIKELLEGCSCDAACYKCLKHYRNQHVHGILDRKAALDLLNWGLTGIPSPPLSLEAQEKLIKPLENILGSLGFKVSCTKDKLLIKSADREKELVIYPAMWAPPRERGNIFVSDAMVKDAKPYAVDHIKTQMEL